MGPDVKNTGSRLVSELQTTSPRSFLLKPMTARFSVLKNVLSGRFNARDDFWVVQVAKKPSQLVFVPSMAISQEDRMGIFVLNRLSHVSHLSGVGLTDFAIPLLGLRWTFMSSRRVVKSLISLGWYPESLAPFSVGLIK